MNLTQYKYLLFDLDDTLLDFKKAERRAFKKLLLNHNIEYSDDLFEKYITINKSLWRKLELGELSSKDVTKGRFKRFFSLLNKEVNDEKYDKEYRIYLAEGNQVFKGVPELLKKLAQTHKLYIATNGVAATQRTRFKNNKLDEYFDYIFISEELGYKKPDKEFFEKVFEIIGSKNKSEVLMIGDNLVSDILGGNNFGIDTCWINAEDIENITNIIPTYKIRSVMELIR
ncbi:MULTISPECIES: YjjG family noncanonical pyrimidine nucleotidase [Gemella]|uniref:YjjG family noncanonical pyrimidine nucleotidase n=1 Tax=Gemella TaxID=1378 RepID=UPI000768406A|nr:MULTISPECIES: YjjG family noncanonical pyrimidine nucleotidase [Gemella]AME09956.1 haloacid dehalogenase [Gemella sp. oral taxon 928]AXI26096.1 noncanonical pyrimidine nucleotidase, YjjG family [Gemella sp. ND 6198]